MAFDISNVLNKTPNSLAIGASTSLCAVIGLFIAYTYLLSLMNGNTQAAKKKIGFMVLYIFLISLLPGVDFFGHFGSLISGALLGMSFLQTGPTFI
jgi:membrane associated rhomboid family serine protease